ncbi:MAG: thioredoxin-disulfide reductase [Flavobacteriales bacterium]|jgi:thioredoxin reductase (NADPH)|nr:thioredoxin-disulfide reductase [Flavobacteriales bacterium]MBK6892283.1 thioredoxin-disulfide reductase [Flavobacteriales bacterium]MBK7246416.1 thioredoxin-disulfide reductase [Flavobacteriales bacterium]MBK9597454.1 thioredoxin-disulfide reductase [Flavobacteriales bacterium]QQS72103.1 MAG: thioredoxin-disulfide reductase [Flavobacteriales bacterium]
MSNTPETLDCLIIGSGPAAYSAAIYAARADLKPVVIEGPVPGGQLTQTTDVDNYPGYPDGRSGPEMMEDLKKQAQRFKTDVRSGWVTKVDFTGPMHKVWVDEKTEIHARTVIIATGASAKWLGLPNEIRLRDIGGGVTACAVCDGFFYKGQTVALVGAGDSAAEEATYLAKLCPKVYMLVRRDEFRASKAMVHRVMNTPQIEVLYNHEVKDVLGDQVVEGIIAVNNKTGEERKLDVSGLFMAIGHTPATELFKDWLDMDPQGYLKHVPDRTSTKIPGVFVSGDAADRVYRQAVTSAGTGCMAALDAERYLAAEGVH